MQNTHINLCVRQKRLGFPSAVGLNQLGQRMCRRIRQFYRVQAKTPDTLVESRTINLGEVDCLLPANS